MSISPIGPDRNRKAPTLTSLAADMKPAKKSQGSDKVAAVYKAASTPANPASHPEALLLRKGETPLHWAVRNHNHNLAFQLKATGHSPLAPDSRGLTPLDEAVLQGDRKMMQALLFADLMSDPQKWAAFSSQFQTAQQKLAALAQVNPNKLSPVCRAAFEGNIEALEAATGLDTPDAKGLTPLHYALLSGNLAAVQYLVSRCNSLHYLTPQGHSYLDYAILSGNLVFFEVFQHFGLPFRLDSQDKLFIYLAASGLLEQGITADARKKDPLLLNGPDFGIGMFNALNLGFQGLGAMTHWLGADSEGKDASATANWLLDCLRWFNQKTHNFATGAHPVLSVMNNVNGFQQLQQQGLLPKAAGKAFQLYAISHAIGRLFGLWSATDYAWAGASELIDSKLGKGASDILLKGFALYKVVGVAKSIFPKIGTYRDTFKSRPADVLKWSAIDAFNLASQSFLCYQSLT